MPDFLPPNSFDHQVSIVFSELVIMVVRQRHVSRPPISTCGATRIPNSPCGGYQTVALNSPFSGFGSRKDFSGGDYETSAGGGCLSAQQT